MLPIVVRRRYKPYPQLTTHPLPLGVWARSMYVLASLWTDPVYLRFRWARWRAPFGTRLDDALTHEASTTSYSFTSPPPVDLVYTWVSGQDPAHRAKRDHWLTQHGLNPRVSNPDLRFVEFDELRYSLRSVERFAPWIRTIFIVTDNQVPAWLDRHSPRVRIIDHQEIFPSSDWLPSFNSSAIESQLHRIPGLAEHFLFANDDMFFGQACRPEDFFCPVRQDAQEQATMRVMLSPSDDDWIAPVHQVRHDADVMLWQAGWNNVKCAVEWDRPWQRIRKMDNHQIQPMTRTVLRSTCERFDVLYRRASAYRFRSLHGVSMLRLARQVALLDGTAVSAWIPCRVFRDEHHLAEHLATPLPPLFCINGTTRREPGVASPLELLFPQPSVFECEESQRLVHPTG
jgi:hypothetical protein